MNLHPRPIQRTRRDRAVASVLFAVVIVGLVSGLRAAPAAGLDVSSLRGTVAFVCEQADGDDELCLMDADGTAVTRITENPGPDRAPTWSPDGTELVFNSRREPHPTLPQIYRLDVGTGTVTRVTEGTLDDQRPSWTPGGDAVVFQRGTFATGFELYRQDLDGGAPLKLTDNPGRINAAGSYSPDGTRLVLQSNRDAAGLFPFGTYIVDGAVSTRIAESVVASHDGPRWSPSGDRLVFSAGGVLYVVDLSDGSVEPVTDGDFSDSSPAWSPDGTKLVFQSDRLDPDLEDDTDITSLHVIDLATGDIVDLGEGRTPVWSPLDRTPDTDPAAPPPPTQPVPPGPTTVPVTAVAVAVRPAFTG